MIGCAVAASLTWAIWMGPSDTKVQVEPAEVVSVAGEEARLSAAPPRSWVSGTKLRHVQHMGPGRGVPVHGAVDPDSIIVRHGSRVLQKDVDYVVDPEWGSLGLGKKPSVTSKDVVLVDYRYSLRRMDSLVRTPDGKQVIRKGTSHLTVPEPPALDPGEKRVANVFVDYGCDGTNAGVFPILESPAQAKTATTAGRIPRTLAKIKAGEPVTVVCWGDSVTVGGDASDLSKTRYVKVFEHRLKQKFPKADINVLTVAVGGSNSRMWLHREKYDAKKIPRVAQCQWELIEKAKPDLVTIEFVNDAYLADKNAFTAVYTDILNRLRNLGAETILITPHFTMPRMMGFKTLREPEKRGYVLNLREFAEQHKLGLADASARWEHLWKEGLPYVTLLRNNINHPEDRGHALFANELMKCFAE